MRLQDQIPITTWVPPYPNTGKRIDLDQWGAAISGFAQGAQGAKKKNQVYSIRIGSLVVVEGSVEVASDTSLVDVLPVIPRLSGFMILFNQSGSQFPIGYSAGSKDMDLSALEAGTYYLSGMYLAQVRS